MRQVQTIKKRICNTDGSSIVSVMTAFIILLLGIAMFSTAILTSNDMIRRADLLNRATGEILERFYPEYAKAPASNAETKVKETDGSIVFKIHGKIDKYEYDVSFKDSDGNTSTLTYEMYYYR